MAKLIWYRIMVVVQCLLAFFFVVLVSDYQQYDAEMLNLKIDTIYENNYDYLDCTIADQYSTEDFGLKKLKSYWFYNYYQFDLQKTNYHEKGLDFYLNPSVINRIPEEVKWVLGEDPHDDYQIALGEDLFNLLNEELEQPITIGSKITIKTNSLMEHRTFAPFEVTLSGVYRTDSHLFSPVVQNKQMEDQAHRTSGDGRYDKNYHPVNESFYITDDYFSSLGFRASPLRVMVEVPSERDLLIETYHQNQRVRACIDSFSIDDSDTYYNGYETKANLANHKKFLEINMIVFGIICIIALLLLVLYLFAATQFVIIENSDKSIAIIFLKELLFYALILLGGGLVYTIYAIIFPWVFLVQPILISLSGFIGFLLLNWMLIFIWNCKELTKKLSYTNQE